MSYILPAACTLFVRNKNVRYQTTPTHLVRVKKCRITLHQCSEQLRPAHGAQQHAATMAVSAQTARAAQKGGAAEMTGLH